MTLRSYLNQSALLLEGVEQLPMNSVIMAYYGFNVSKMDQEPIDQIQGFLIAKRIQEWNQKKFGESGLFIPFIGGLFEILNCKNTNDISNVLSQSNPKELAKQKMFNAISELFQINCECLITKNLWQDQQYWKILKNLFDKQVFTRGLLINNALNFYDSKDQLMATMKVKELPRNLVDLPLECIKKIGNYPASLLYTPAEVTEAFYLSEKYGINTKLGQSQERVYDRYMYNNFSVFRLKQPVALNSKKNNPLTVTPYIAKSVNNSSGKAKKSLRIYFSDTVSQIQTKIETTLTEEYVYTVDEKYGEVLNPILEKAILAVETARILNNKIQIKSTSLNTGSDVIEAVTQGFLSVAQIKKQLANLLYQNIIQPIGAKI